MSAHPLRPHHDLRGVGSASRVSEGRKSRWELHGREPYATADALPSGGVFWRRTRAILRSRRNCDETSTFAARSGRIGLEFLNAFGHNPANSTKTRPCTRPRNSNPGMSKAPAMASFWFVSIRAIARAGGCPTLSSRSARASRSTTIGGGSFLPGWPFSPPSDFCEKLVAIRTVHWLWPPFLAFVVPPAASLAAAAWLTTMRAILPIFALPHSPRRHRS